MVTVAVSHGDILVYSYSSVAKALENLYLNIFGYTYIGLFYNFFSFIMLHYIIVLYLYIFICQPKGCNEIKFSHTRKTQDVYTKKLSTDP